ncbi:chloride channel protein [Chitinibacter tainanensis]|uniref:chloride channel protein n=1 Tax=Chitinibacter tainanensis TaxID=230667 RepID=UPI0004129A6F|nr:chloride channel protein [Chitinibacter tainanensis]
MPVPRLLRHYWLRLSHTVQQASTSSRQTALLWLGAALVGLVAVLLAKAAEYAFGLFSWAQGQWRFAPLLLVPAGGVAALWLMRRLGEGAQGSGIPQTKAALETTHAPARTSQLLSLRIALAKFIGIVAGLASGFVLGREGPTVQIGASLMHSLHGFARIDTPLFRRQLILAGGAAGIAAAFNTPLAGIVFAFEELARSVEEQTSGKLLGAVIIAGVVSLALLGDYVYFGRIHVPGFSAAMLLPIVLIGGVAGLVGGIFSWTCIHAQRWLPASVQQWRTQAPYRFVALCGLLIALLGLLAPIHGSGAEITSAAINQGSALPWYFTPLKWAGMVLTFLTGLPGGIFAPSLSLGAGVGSWFAPLFATTPPVKLMAIGMVGLLAAVTRAPLTAAVIMMEMTDGHDMVISSLAAAMLASAVARQFKVNLYHALADQALSRLR